MKEPNNWAILKKRAKMEDNILKKAGLEVSHTGLSGIPIQRITAEETKPLLQQLSNAGINVY